MTPECRTKLKNLLINHEQLKLYPYTDITGHLTIGVGRNLSTRGISSTEALYLLEDDIFYFISKLAVLDFFDALDDNRKIVLVDMCFNLGLHGFLGFKEMLKAVEDKDYSKAADEILNSKAAHQCRERYNQLAYIMRTGEL